MNVHDEPTCDLCLTPQSGEPCGYCARHAVEVEGHGVIAEHVETRERPAVRGRWAVKTPFGARFTVRLERQPGPVHVWTCTCEAEGCKHVAVVKWACALRGNPWDFGEAA